MTNAKAANAKKPVSQEFSLSVPLDADRTEEFQDGVLARQQGLRDTVACPHKHGDRRTRFMSGYWSEDVRISMSERLRNRPVKQATPVVQERGIV